MIGALEGTIKQITIDTLLLMVQGVGYVVYCPSRLLVSMSVGSELFVYTHMHVREDALSLFGFIGREDLKLFELLIGVSGIGPKTALLVVDRGVEEVIKAVLSADVSFFTGIPRLGTKNAQKIIIELKSKLGNHKELDLHESHETQEMVDVLMRFGFARSEILSVMKHIPIDVHTSEGKIKAALKLLGKGPV